MGMTLADVAIAWALLVILLAVSVIAVAVWRAACRIFGAALDGAAEDMR